MVLGNPLAAQISLSHYFATRFLDSSDSHVENMYNYSCVIICVKEINATEVKVQANKVCEVCRFSLNDD